VSIVLAVRIVLALVLAYLLGTVPFGLLVTRAAGMGDIRKIGSGNIGATNVLRTGRKDLAAATLVLDGLKGAAAVVAGALIAGLGGVIAAGIGVILGHIFPVWLNFKGGKGVATGAGVLLAAAPLAGAAAAAIWLGVAFATRISSAGALAATAVAPLLAWVSAGGRIALMVLVVSALIWWRHAANIRRLLAGTEPRIGQAR
jgi:glycerol-3-phosphate acyltransferase PlsY